MVANRRKKLNAVHLKEYFLEEINKARKDQKKEGYIFYVDVFDSHRGADGLAIATIDLARKFGFNETTSGGHLYEKQDEAMVYLSELIEVWEPDLYFGFNEGDGSVGN